jgi:hypothetical protein
MKCTECEGVLAEDEEVVIVNAKHDTAQSLVRKKCMDCGRYFYIKSMEEK